MKEKYIKWALALAAVGAAGTLLDAYFLEKYFFNIKTFDIGDKRSDTRLRLILLTDLHLKHKLPPQYSKLASEINQLQPDLILITGDTLDSSGNTDVADQFFSLRNHQVQKVAIPGNHDHLAEDSLAELGRMFAKHNGDLLINESRCYTIDGTNVMVTGLDDFIQGETNLEAAVKDVVYEEHHLLLIHSPLQQEKAIARMKEINRQRSATDRLNIRYIFAGHNHGGQVRLPGYVPVLPKKSGDYVQGWYNASAPYLYVSKGFGTSRLPFRFFARSEVTLFNYYV